MIEETKDYELIKSIVTEPRVWATVAEDGHDREAWEPDLSQGWLVAKDEDGEIIGLYTVHAHNSITLEIHPFVLPEFRGAEAYQSGKEVLQWIKAKTKYQKVVCSIPVIYRNVKLFAMRCGLKQEGVNRKSYLKHGIIHDQWMLGITRNEI